MGSFEPEFPKVTLDTTLADLYTLDNDGKIPQLVYSIPSPNVQVSTSMPIPLKYPYQATRIRVLGTDMLARTYLATGAQYYGFVAGKMHMTLFNPDQYKNEDYPDADGNRIHVTDAWRVREQFHEHQKPELEFVNDSSEIQVEEGSEVALMLPTDNLEHLPLNVDPGTHYKLLSKRELAVGTLPTPPTQLIDCELTVDEAQDEVLIADETARFVTAIEERQTPFVIKLPQGLAGQGVFLVRSESERAAAIKILIPEIERMIERLDETNEHLNPACLVLQDMIPGSAVALSFFVTKAGRAIYTGCVEQDVDVNGQWHGAMIDYTQQKNLEAQYTDIMEQIAEYCYTRGYWGPMGADVMTDVDGNQLVIDLNVRVTGSYGLGLMKNHFSVQRGCHYASLMFPVGFKGTRADFDNNYSKELADGRIVVCGWCHGRIGPWGMFKYSVASLIAAAETPELLHDLIAKINARVVQP